MDIVEERFELSRVRIREIAERNSTGDMFDDFFVHEAMITMHMLEDELSSGEECEQSYVDKGYSYEGLGIYSSELAFLAAELHGAERLLEDSDILGVTIRLELFLEFYTLFHGGDSEGEITHPSIRSVHDAIYYFESDYVNELTDGYSYYGSREGGDDGRILKDHMNDIFLYLDARYADKKINVLKKLLKKGNEQQARDFSYYLHNLMLSSGNNAETMVQPTDEQLGLVEDMKRKIDDLIKEFENEK